MRRSVAGFLLWAGVTFALTIFMLQLTTTSYGGENGPSFHINFGWSEVTGTLLNIKCADPTPVKTVSTGLPFAYKYTEHICTGENEITPDRTNIFAILFNTAIAAVEALVLVFIGMRMFWRQNS
jgi:hypothetical protein